MERFDYLFNHKFTRADEDHANVYEQGLHVIAKNMVEARAEHDRRTSHLTIDADSVVVIAVYTYHQDGPETLIYKKEGL